MKSHLGNFYRHLAIFIWSHSGKGQKTLLFVVVWPPLLIVPVWHYHPAAQGSNHKHNMYAFLNHIVQIDTLCLVCEKNENKQKDTVIGPCFVTHSFKWRVTFFTIYPKFKFTEEMCKITYYVKFLKWIKFQNGKKEPQKGVAKRVKSILNCKRFTRMSEEENKKVTQNGCFSH